MDWAEVNAPMVRISRPNDFETVERKIDLEISLRCNASFLDADTSLLLTLVLLEAR